MAVALETRTLDIISYSNFLKLSPRQKKDCVLINEVKRHRVVYDRSEIYRKRRKLLRVAWERIGSLMGRDAGDCMNRWKMLRDRYRREKKIRLQLTPEQIAKKKPWVFQKMLTFLDPHMEERVHLENDEERNEENEKEGDEEIENDKDTNEENQKEGNEKNPDESSRSDFPVVKEEKDAVQSSTQGSPQTGDNPANVQFIRIIVPPNGDLQPVPQVPNKRSPKKYCKILPKPLEPVTDYLSLELKEQSSNDGAGFFTPKESDKRGTVDHLMAFMSTTIKQLPYNRQIKVTHELTAAFFDIISNEDES